MTRADGSPSESISDTLPNDHDTVPAEIARPLAIDFGWRNTAAGDRYEPGAILGRGGMGEVRLSRDVQIGRDVALKSLRTEIAADETSRTRFVREARIQGQLEHPAIVPVYDLGQAPDGALFFSMKCVRGSSLRAILDGIAAGESAVVRRYTQRKLLDAFSTVCQAVDFANHRGVIHRDLKPGNIMLGAFGEVHVIDWGVAKVVAADRDDGAPDSERITSDSSLETRAGAIIGTPGYMSPEQARAESLDGRSDVYALGAVLFEMLTQEKLHRAENPAAVLYSTLAGVDAEIVSRATAHGIDPVLAEICRRATLLDREARYRTAGELAEAVERFLDDEHERQQRMRMADAHALAAEGAVTRALASGAAERDRAVALNEIGRALALNPAHAGALRAIAKLLAEPPPAAPAEVLASQERDIVGHVSFAAKMAAAVHALWLLALPLFVWMGIRRPVPIATFFVLEVAAAVVAAIIASRRALAPRLMLVEVLLNGAAMAVLYGVLGPLVLVPAIALGHTAPMMLYPDRTTRRASVVVGILAMAGPLLLQLSGALPASYSFHGGAMTIEATFLTLRALPTSGLLLATSVSSLVAACWAMHALRAAIMKADERVRFVAWQLQQLVPVADLEIGTARGAKSSAWSTTSESVPSSSGH